jgi:hypothetical protein
MGRVGAEHIAEMRPHGGVYVAERAAQQLIQSPARAGNRKRRPADGDRSELIDQGVFEEDDLHEAECRYGILACSSARQPLNLSSEAQKFLVDAKLLKPPTNYKGLRAALGTKPANLINAQAHHDLPWHLNERFARYGLNVNLP